MNRGFTTSIVILAATATLAADSPPLAIAPSDAQQARAHQEAWARHLVQPLRATNTLGMSLVLIPPGEFMMGGSRELLAETAAWADTKRQSPAGVERIRIETDEQPQHRVRLTKPFRIGTTEVTIGQFRRFVVATQYFTETERFGGGNSGKTDETVVKNKSALWNTPGYKVTDDSPVTQITWNDMVAFCNWLSEQEKLAPCYRLDDRQAFQLIAGTNGCRAGASTLRASPTTFPRLRATTTGPFKARRRTQLTAPSGG